MSVEIIKTQPELESMDFYEKCPAPAVGLASLVQHRYCTSPGHFHLSASKATSQLWSLISNLLYPDLGNRFSSPGSQG